MKKTNDPCVILIEDIDCIGKLHRRSNKNQNGSKNVVANQPNIPISQNGITGITLAGVLNGLDGCASQDGRIVIMTTNHVEHLDPALVRSGRVDFKYQFGHCCSEQAQKMFLHFFPDAEIGEQDLHAFGENVERLSVSASDLQGHLMACRDDYIAAIIKLNSEKLVMV